MADETEDDIEIITPDGEPLDDDGFAVRDPVIAGITEDPVGEKEQTATDKADDAFQTLQRNFDQLKQVHGATEQELQTLRQRAESAALSEHETQKALLGSARARAEEGLKSAKFAYAAALKAQDFDAAAEAQEAIVHHTADVREFAAAFDEMEASPPKPQPRQPAPAAVPNDHKGKVDAFLDQFSPETRAFAEKYRDQIFPEGDAAPLQQVMAAHQLAVAKKIKPDTPAYFDFIEAQMEFKPPVAQKTETKQQPRPAPKPVGRKQTAAPANRGPSGSTVGNQVVLSRDEVVMARKLGMTPAAYGKNKKTMMDRAGDPDYTGPRYSRDDPAIQGGRR